MDSIISLALNLNHPEFTFPLLFFRTLWLKISFRTPSLCGIRRVHAHRMRAVKNWTWKIRFYARVVLRI